MWWVKYVFLIPIPQTSIPLFLRSVYSSKLCRQHFHCLSVGLFFIYLVNNKHISTNCLGLSGMAAVGKQSLLPFDLHFKDLITTSESVWSCSRGNAKTQSRYNFTVLHLPTVRSSLYQSRHMTSSLHKSLPQSFCLLATFALVVQPKV